MLEEIIAVVHARSSAPALIELGRTHRGGQIDRTVYAWSNGRITAAVGSDGVELQRRCGAVTRSPFILEARALRTLAIVCDDWAARRSSWAAFYVSAAGYPPGFGAAAYYQPCGDDAVPEAIGRELFGRAREGEWLIGRDEIRELHQRAHVGPGIEVTAEIWRRGERRGNRSGEVVGCVYEVGALRAHAYRRHLRVACGDDAIVLESGEEAFISELAAVVSG